MYLMRYIPKVSYKQFTGYSNMKSNSSNKFIHVIYQLRSKNSFRLYEYHNVHEMQSYIPIKI